VAKPKQAPSPKLATLKVDVGFGDSFKNLTLVPVRVTAHNRTSNTVSGMLQIPDLSTSSNYQPAQAMPYRAVYQAPLVLPPNATKEVTLYLPSASVNGSVHVRLHVGNQVVGSAVAQAAPFDQSIITVGALTDNPADVAWIKRISPGAGEQVTTVRLTPRDLDPVAAALANFDVIVLNDGSVAALDTTQLSALEQYVGNGGALVLVGGPGWQADLRPLPPPLVPGRLAGSATVNNLLALRNIDSAAAKPPGSSAAATVSVLRHPTGDVLASEQGIPLAVEDQIGSGHVLYMAFDPSFAPIVNWPGAGAILTGLFTHAAPQAFGEATASSNGGGRPVQFFSQYGGFLNIAGELNNVPAAALPSTVLFLILIGLYIFLLGPVSFFVLRRFKRQALVWVTVPLGGLLCVGATFGVSGALKSRTVLVNTVGMVTLDGPSNARPFNMYMGLFAPLAGDYHLSFGAPAYPTTVPTFTYYNIPQRGHARSLGLRFQQGAATQVQFVHMNMWSMRDAALSTTVNLPGTVQSRLHVDSQGYIVGTVHNGTSLSLIKPAIVAGRGYGRLPDIPAGKTVSVRIKPGLDVYSHYRGTVWTKLYGYPRYSSYNGYGQGGPISVYSINPIVQKFSYGGGGGYGYGYCCPGPAAPRESNVDQRIRNVANQLPGAQNVTQMGELLFVAWTEQPLGPVTVDGVTPQRRDLNLVVKPLSVGFARGPFTLLTGTFGANLVAVDPVAPNSNQNNCCWRPSPNAINIGHGGSATFEFTLPRARRVHFTELYVNVNAGGARGFGMGRVWDCRASRWVHYDLSQGYAKLLNPDRFISSRGTLTVMLVNEDPHRTMMISDPHQNVQINGKGYVS
jgi:hypothetical protein